MFLFQLEFRKRGLLKILWKDKCLNLKYYIYLSFFPFHSCHFSATLQCLPSVDPGALPVSQSDNFPNFPLPSQPANFCTVLDEDAMRSYTELSIPLPDSIALDNQTREQNTNTLWFQTSSIRITSTSFKRICSRRAELSTEVWLQALRLSHQYRQRQ